MKNILKILVQIAPVVTAIFVAVAVTWAIPWDETDMSIAVPKMVLAIGMVFVLTIGSFLIFGFIEERYLSED